MVDVVGSIPTRGTKNLMTRYLFLDIDGVLNSEATVAAYGKITHCGRVKQDLVDGNIPEPMWNPISVVLLKAAQEALDFKIVISSTWRSALSLNDFFTIFDLYGWDTRQIIIGKTGNEAGKRGNQIKAWLDAHGKYPYQYCIIDDDSDMLDSQMHYFVKTAFTSGLGFEEFINLFMVFDEQYNLVGAFEPLVKNTI